MMELVYSQFFLIIILGKKKILTYYLYFPSKSNYHTILLSNT